MVGRITTRRAKKAAKLFTPKKPKAVKPARPPITARPTPPKAAPVGRLGPALLRKPAPAPKPRPAPILARPAPLPAPTPSSSSGGGGGGGGSGGGGGKGLFSGEDDDLDEDSDYTDSDDETEESEDESEDESTDFDSDNEESEDEESEDESEDEDSDMELGALEQATNLAMRAITPLANSPRTHRHHNHSHNKAQRALSAVAPIANAFGTPAEMVIRSVDARLIQYGYPPGTAANLFAALSDLNDSLEQSSKDIISKLPPAEAATLRQLSNIAQKLPRCHPTRTRAHLNIVRHRG
jgi:hypothetical protein